MSANWVWYLKALVYFILIALYPPVCMYFYTQEANLKAIFSSYFPLNDIQLELFLLQLLLSIPLWWHNEWSISATYNIL